MKKIISYIAVLLLTVLSTTSCNDWLDITPKGEAEASDILKDEQGYNYALNGVYYKLSSTTLYGKEMTFGAMDALAQYWNFSTTASHSYKELSNYNYLDAKTITFFNEFWSMFYGGITQTNQILESLEVNGSSLAHPELFKGEALALRAFMHFELLKYFGPLIRTEADLGKKAIAYRHNFDVIALEFNTVKEVLDYAKADLLQALELLKEDPIKVNGREGDGNENLLDYSQILKRRGTRMNYYGVLGLLVRLEMWRGNTTQAYTYAKRLLDECSTNLIGNNPVIRLNPKEDFNANQEAFRDIICQKEFVFALYRDDLYDVTGPMFYHPEYNAVSDASILLTLDQYNTIVNHVYGRSPDGAGTDYRIKYWFNSHHGNNNYYVFGKLKKPTQTNTTPPVPYWPEIPIIKLSEIYYTACECQIGVDNALALEYLNRVREERGLPPLEGTFGNSQMEEYLTREMRKDFFGEGVMFGYYKRKFKAIDASEKLTVEPLESNFIFPIPDDEYEFSPNEK